MDADKFERRARAGPALLMARRAVSVLAALASITVIARILGPKAYGLATMSTVIFQLALILRDFGLTSASLRRLDISEKELSWLFWANCLITALVGTVVVASAPMVATLFRQPVVSSIIRLSAMGFIAGGLALQHEAILRRNLRFAEISGSEIVSIVAGFVTSVMLALIRRDVWAIVIGSLVQNLTFALLVVLFARWRPGPPSRIPGMRGLVAFGLNASAFSISTFIANNCAAVLIGRSLGPIMLGEFNRAQTVFQLPIANIVEPVAQATMPVLTRLSDRPPLYRDAYLQLSRRLTLVVAPLAAILCLTAQSLVLVVLGPKWMSAGIILAALAPALAGYGAAYSLGDLFITQNRSSELRNLGVIEMIFRVASIAVGVTQGIVGAAVAISISTLTIIPVRMWVAGREGPVTFPDQLGTLSAAARPVFGALVIGFGATMASQAFGADPLVTLISVGSAGIFGMVAGLASSKQASADVLVLIRPAYSRASSLLRRLRRSQKSELGERP